MSTQADMFQDWPQRSIPDLQPEAPNIRRMANVRQAHTTELKWKPAPDKSVVDWLQDVHLSKGRIYEENERRKPYVDEDSFDVDSYAVANDDNTTTEQKDDKKSALLWGDDTVIALGNSQLHEHPLTIIKRSTLSSTTEWVCKLCNKVQHTDRHMQCTEGCGFTACISCVDTNKKSPIQYTERDLRNIRIYAKIPDPILLVPFDFECVQPPNSSQLTESSILMSAYKRPMSRVEQLQDDDDYYLSNSKRGWNSSNQGQYDRDRRHPREPPPVTRGFFDEPSLIQSYPRGNQSRRPYYDRDNETFGDDYRDERFDTHYHDSEQRATHRTSKVNIAGALDKFMELNPHLRVRKEAL